MQGQELRFRMKRGVGSHYYKGKKYVAGEEIRLPEHVAQRIKDKLIRIDPAPDEPEPEFGFVIVHLGDDTYDVVNDADGKSINDEPMTLKEARALAGDKAPVQGREQEQEQEQEGDDAEVVKAAELAVRHRGGGRYVIVNKGTNKPVTDELFTKQECESIIAGDVTVDQVLAGR